MKAFLIFTLLISMSAFARIAKVDENILEDDLNFKLDQEEQEVRDVASDEEADPEKAEQEESERDVASENEDANTNIKYWKY